jgi:hypothetical protein
VVDYRREPESEDALDLIEKEVERVGTRPRQKTLPGGVKPPFKPNLSPPPTSIPPSVGEQRALAKAHAKLQDKEERIEELKRQLERQADVNRMVREAQEHAELKAAAAKKPFDFKGLALVITALGGIGIGGWAKATSVQPDKVEAHGVLLREEAKQSEKVREWRLAFVKYAKDLDAYYDCRVRQVASATGRSAGYDFGFEIDGVEWDSVCLPRAGQICKGPVYRARITCPNKPDVPQ